MKPRILLTGGAGFLGGFTAARLCRTAELTVLDDLSTGDARSLRGLPLRLKRLRAWSPDAIRFLSRGRFDTVVHLAANAYIKTSVDRPDFDFENNLVEPFRLLEAVRSMKKRPRLLFASTAAVHGESRGRPFREDDGFLSPLSPYGAGKLALEHYARIYAKVYGLKTQCVRLYPMFGPRQKKQVVYDLLRKISAPGNSFEVFGSGREVRDFLYVEDAADGICLILRRALFDGGTINLCTSRGVAVKTVVGALLKEMGSKKKARYTRKLRAGDADRMTGSNARIRALGFKPAVSFEEGIRRTVEWFRGL